MLETAIRSWKQVSQMVQMTAQDLALFASYCTPLLLCISQPTQLVTNADYHTVTTPKIPYEKDWLHGWKGIQESN